MKKLTLNLDFAKEELSKEEMKKINGGFGDYCGKWCSYSECGIDQYGVNWGTSCPACVGSVCSPHY